MKKNKYILIIVVILILLAITLGFKIYNNGLNYDLLKEQEETKEIIEHNSFEENIADFNSEDETCNVIENTKNNNIPDIEKDNYDESNSIDSDKTIMQQTDEITEVTEEKKSKSSTTIDSNSSSKSWTTNTTYGGEIHDQDGETGSYWEQGGEIDLTGIDMSDWTIK